MPGSVAVGSLSTTHLNSWSSTSIILPLSSTCQCFFSSCFHSFLPLSLGSAFSSFMPQTLQALYSLPSDVIVGSTRVFHSDQSCPFGEISFISFLSSQFLQCTESSPRSVHDGAISTVRESSHSCAGSIISVCSKPQWIQACFLTPFSVQVEGVTIFHSP